MYSSSRLVTVSMSEKATTHIADDTERRTKYHVGGRMFVGEIGADLGPKRKKCALAWITKHGSVSSEYYGVLRSTTELLTQAKL